MPLRSTFQTLCNAPDSAGADQKLPAYSFVEPRFVPELGLLKINYPNDYHPPHNVCRGEQFLASVYTAVRQSPYRDKILLVITFDEHGGCYDHVPPPAGAAAPQPGAVSRYDDFHFDRFGVRVPTIVISSYVQPGTVFRAAAGNPPFDHTSILATLRDWKNMTSDPDHPFLPSPRIAAAPTLDQVLTLSDSTRNTNWPDIFPGCVVGPDDKSLDMPLNDLQTSLIAAEATRRNNNTYIGSAAVETLRTRIRTYQHAIDYLRQKP